MKQLLFFALTLAFISCNSGEEKKESKQDISVKLSPGDSLLAIKNWTIRDYTAATAIFKKLKQEDLAALRKYVHGEGKSLFEKIVDRAGYTGMLTGGEMQKKLILLEMASLSADLFKLFLDAGRENGKYVLGHEIARSFMASLVLDRILTTESYKIFPDIEALTETQKGGLQKTKKRSFQFIRAVLITMHTDYPLYEKEDIVDLSRFLVPHIEKMRPFLDTEYLDEIHDGIEKLIRSGVHEESKRAFAE